MKNHLLPFLAITLFAGGTLLASDQTSHKLKGPLAEATIDADGFHLDASPNSSPPIHPGGEPVWAVLLQPVGGAPVQGEPIVITNQRQDPTLHATADHIRVTYDKLSDGSRTWDIGLALDIRLNGDAFEIAGELRNSAQGWVVCGFIGPVLNGIQADLSKQPLLTPDGFGRITHRPPGADKGSKPWAATGDRFELSSPYPSRSGSMQWCAFAGPQGGLYLGCHDGAHAAKDLCVRYSPGSRAFAFAIKHHVFCPPGDRRALPPLVIRPYQGTWHAAARHYRAWFDSVRPVCQAPAWARNASGWLLCILKQQNGEVMWDYRSLNALCDVADKRGLDMLGLFGWAHGGHDHLYPDYNPDPPMGGEPALRAALKEVRRRGKRSIIYANGQLQERDTDFWNKTGKGIAVMQRDGESVQQTYHKYDNIPKYRFDLGCLVSKPWYDRMLALAVQAHDLGADGILFDQLGMSKPMACYGQGHGHPVPEMVYASERPAFIQRIAEHMKSVDPEFIVMTEGLHDSVLDSISMFHGCVIGTFYASADDMAARLASSRTTDAFPEMFRYTFPEVMSTVRVPTPMMDRGMANYTCAYGMRYEIESRYAADVSYLREDRVPGVEDYPHVINKPDIAMMKATPPGDAASYMKKLISFQREHAEIFWGGRFVDTTGFSFAGEGLVAKGFEAEDRIAVILWNTLQKAAPIKIDVPGAELISAADPEHSPAGPLDPLAPQSVRLLIWKRQGPAK